MNHGSRRERCGCYICAIARSSGPVWQGNPVICAHSSLLSLEQEQGILDRIPLSIHFHPFRPLWYLLPTLLSTRSPMQGMCLVWCGCVKRACVCAVHLACKRCDVTGRLLGTGTFLSAFFARRASGRSLRLGACHLGYSAFQRRRNSASNGTSPESSLLCLDLLAIKILRRDSQTRVDVVNHLTFSRLRIGPAPSRKRSTPMLCVADLRTHLEHTSGPTTKLD